ncbi:MAG: thioredoxin family protein [Actinomycetota bacterium]
MKVTLLYFDHCPNWVETDQHLTRLQAEIPNLETVRQRVETPEDAERLGFRGSPSILINGVDPFANTDAPVGLSCRIHTTPSGPAGSPTFNQLRDALANHA